MKTATALLATLALGTALHAGAAPEVVTTYRVRQNATVSDIPAGAKEVKFWVSIPDNERYQEVLDFDVVSSPGSWSVVREPDRGNRFMLVEVKNPGATSLTSTVEFTVRRRSVFTELDPAKAGSITDSHRTLYAEELRKDAPHMAVSKRIAKVANEAAGTETNVAAQAQLLLAAVADYADHYSKDPTKPNCGIGDAEDCMTNAGGCCTDLHSMFIAMARARGIPARLQMGYRLREPNAGKETDPGYRCWAEYFVPNYGWVSADIVEADDTKGLGRTRWFTGLTERRLWLNEGREFDLAGRAVTSKRVNTMIIGYAEIDGVEARVLPDGDKKAQLTRTVFYTEVAPAAEPVKVASTN
ncbi:MAG TPA: transglutaminase domain-containing protein [Opitutaceae bacterium]|nr:transglutaminase domain-containing protein [Opitutaceae bacterium]